MELGALFRVVATSSNDAKSQARVRKRSTEKAIPHAANGCRGRHEPGVMTHSGVSSSPHPRNVRHWLRKLITFWTLIAVVSAIALFAFADIGEDVAEQSTTRFDNAVSAWFMAHQNPLVYKLALALTWIGSPTVMIVLAIVAAGLFFTRGGRSKAGVVVAAPAVGGILSGLIKIAYGRVRPAGAALLNERTYSFPSGHAATSAAVAVALCYVLARERIISWPSAIVIGGAVPLVVGLTRLYLNVHWTTDVVAGWTVGLFVAAMSAAVYERLRSSAPPSA
jgi:undecaprenyl-diphosphatase